MAYATKRLFTTFMPSVYACRRYLYVYAIIYWYVYVAITVYGCHTPRMTFGIIDIRRRCHHYLAGCRMLRRH